MFNHRLFRVFVAMVLLLLIAITSIGFAAFPRSETSGNFITTSTIVNSVTQDKFNKIFDLSSTTTYTGTLEGISTLHGTLTVRRDGSARFTGVETFTGLVNGTPGTLTFNFDGNNNLYQEIQLTNLIISGTGELSNLQGQLSKTGIIKDNGPVGTYTGQINTISNPNVEGEESDEY